MKWLFVVLLFVNAVFLGLTFARSVNRDDINSEFNIVDIDSSQELTLLQDLEQLPPVRGNGDWMPPYEEWQDQSQTDAGQQSATQGRVQDSIVTEYEQDTSILMENSLFLEEVTCYSFGPIFSNREAEMLRNYLAKYLLPHNSREEDGVEVYYGVYLRPAKSVVALAELIDSMKAKGIDNYRLVSSGELRNNLSLGVYTTREDVDARLSQLKDKGFEPIVVPKSSDSAVWLNVLVEPHLGDADFMATLLQRDDRFVVECSEVGLDNGSSGL
ncbi:MAG: SPOR domain-containing protein [Candidatus Porifericomitaceae bacterium WSBS_2022_MAG_OTU9]